MTEDVRHARRASDGTIYGVVGPVAKDSELTTVRRWIKSRKAWSKVTYNFATTGVQKMPKINHPS